MPGKLVKRSHTSTNPYPAEWERVAELRVFHATPAEWEKLIGWRADMQRKGWRLLQVSSGTKEILAVFGRTKAELLDRKADA
jgi:hypothetical protein